MKKYITTVLVCVIVCIGIYFFGYHRGQRSEEIQALHKKYERQVDSLNNILGKAETALVKQDKALTLALQKQKVDSLDKVQYKKQNQQIHVYYKKVIDSYTNAPDTVLDNFLRTRADKATKGGTH